MKKNIFSEKSYFCYLLGQSHFKKLVFTYNILHDKSWPFFYSALDFVFILLYNQDIIYIYENIPWNNKIFGTISDHRYLNHIYLWNLALLLYVVYIFCTIWIRKHFAWLDFLNSVDAGYSNAGMI